MFAAANDLSDLIAMVGACAAGDFRFCPTDPSDLEFRGNPANVFRVILERINNAIAAFVAAGTRDILVPNMPNPGVIPAVTQYGANSITLATALSTQYNPLLDEMLKQRGGYVHIIPFDTFSLVTAVVQDPGVGCTEHRRLGQRVGWIGRGGLISFFIDGCETAH